MMQKTAQGTAYQLYGNPSSPAIVFIHGLGLTRQTWEDFVPAFQDDYFVILYDLCGHGESALPAETPSLRILSDQLAELLAFLEVETAHLVGFSLGGMINRRFAMDRPHQVASLSILNSPHERDETQQQLVEQRAKDTSDGGAAATIETTLERWFTKAFREQSPVKTDWVRQTVLANHPANYANHRFVLANGVLELIRPVPAIRAPSLVMTCENDTGSNVDMSQAIASEIEGSQLIIVPGLQHLGLIERPDLFIAPLQKFLKNLP